MKILQNKYFQICAFAVVVIIALFFYGQCERRKGEHKVIDSEIKKHTDKELKYWTDSVGKLLSANYELLRDDTLTHKHNRVLLKSLSAYQMHQSTIRSTNVATIKKESDKIKDSTIDAIQTHDKNGLLIDYVNYNSLLNSYDSCQQANSILLQNATKDSLLIVSNYKLLSASDSLSRWSVEACNNDLKSEHKKVRKRTLWLGFLVAVNVAKDIFAVEYLVRK